MEEIRNEFELQIYFNFEYFRGFLLYFFGLTISVFLFCCYDFAADDSRIFSEFEFFDSV